MADKKLVVGILAHVDAGKTTLAESILYTTGKIRKPGRVDHGNAFLDTFELERSRGITIFAKQAELKIRDTEITLLDTPGHVDFSAEMERTLHVLDYAVLVISGADGVQGHVRTLWKLLKRYGIPAFLFINKMDQPDTDRRAILLELQKKLDSACVDFTEEGDSLYENIAVCDERVLEYYLENGTMEDGEIRKLIRERKVFPCYFGSALKLEGIGQFLDGLEYYTEEPVYPDAFGAKVFKIARDSQGNRLTYLKVTGGTLKVKMPLKGEEKADQIRIYSGSGFSAVSEAKAGTVCAVTGLDSTYAGEGLGTEEASVDPFLEPVLTYRVSLPDGCDVHSMLLHLRELEEEEPELHIVWDEHTDEIHAQVMGEIQIEILKNMIRERFGTDVEFDAGSIVYRETVGNTVEGAGHFEPLRHYAEVRLRIEPGERGSGIICSSECSEDMLDRNWQRLIMTHLEEKAHKGVLTGAELTDVKLILTAGRAHLKHTEGGDFRQATYRAVRQGLKKAENILLEPFYEYQLEVPAELVGRAMSDIQRMCGTFSPPDTDGETAVLKGSAPVSAMRDYQREVISYTKGRGRLFCTPKGYEPCHNADEVIAASGYDAEADMDNPSGSVFCTHGAGFYVGWDEVEDYMHTESAMQIRKADSGLSHASSVSCAPLSVDESELQEIFERTYGPIKRERTHFKKQVAAPAAKAPKKVRPVQTEEEYLLVDGYNIIFAWEELKELSKINLDAARSRLMDILCNYQGYKKCTLILVFDAYKVPGHPGQVQKYHNIHVVYTKEAETADQYIEKTVHKIGRSCRVTVATSDALEQVIILGQGAQRMSAPGLLEEVQLAVREMRAEHLDKETGKNYLFAHLSDEMSGIMEDVRMGKKEL